MRNLFPCDLSVTQAATLLLLCKGPAIAGNHRWVHRRTLSPLNDATLASLIGHGLVETGTLTRHGEGLPPRRIAIARPTPDGRKFAAELRATQRRAA